MPTTRPATSGCWGWWGAIRAALRIAYESKWTYFLLALVPSLCDCGLAWLVYRTAKRSSRGVKEHTALVLTAFTAFNPLMLFDTGVWKQIDGAFALPLVLCFVLLEQRRYLPAAVLYGVALAIKPQALLFGPVLAVCYLAAITLEKGPPARLWPLLWWRGAGTAAAAADRSAFFWRCAVDPEADRQIHRHNVRLPLRDDQRL